MNSTLFLIDYLQLADIDAPGPDYAQLQNMAIGRSIEPSIFQHPDSTIVFPELPIEGGTLVFAIGIKSSAWEKIQSPVNFEVGYHDDETGDFESLYKRQLDPGENHEDREWKEERLELPKLPENGKARLAFRTAIPEGGKPGYNWSGWGNPVIELPRPLQRKSKSTSKDHAHLFFITCDSLAKRFLGCYGNEEVSTPNMDALAAEGLIFDDALSQSTVTPGSYASFFTSLLSTEHKLTAESHTLSPALPTLPVFLRGRGYHTVFAPSERDLSVRGGGFPLLFEHVFPCLANPAQNGGVTTRTFRNWIGERPDQPCFGWLHYFEPHPPVIPPVPFRTMYYEGDPADPAREYRSEDIQEIRGSECVLGFKATLPWLKQGKGDHILATCLEDTAHALMKDVPLEPDLAPLLKNLGKPAQRGMCQTDFGKWLLSQVPAAKGEADASGLIEWMEQVLPLLFEIEQDVLNWLKGVCDFRFPMNQYKGAISYVDSLIGEVVSVLKEEGIYEQSTIVLTSPHGEVISGITVPFHHHALLPEVLDLPLIVKPGRAMEIEPRRVSGTFDSIDFAPTMTELLGSSWPFLSEGVSHAASLKTGADLPERTSFAFDIAEVMASATSGKVVLIKGLVGKAMRSDLYIDKGSCLVVDRATGEMATYAANELPGDLQSLDDELNAWLARAL